MHTAVIAVSHELIAGSRRLVQAALQRAEALRQQAARQRAATIALHMRGGPADEGTIA